MRTSTSLAVLLLLSVNVHLARAEAPTSSQQNADALFEQGKQRLAAGDYASACPLFAGSLQLDPATGTLLALAMCLERSGDRDKALVHYREVLRRSEAEGRSDRAAAARSRIALLSPTTNEAQAPATSQAPAVASTEPAVAESVPEVEPEAAEAEAEVAVTPAEPRVVPETPHVEVSAPVRTTRSTHATDSASDGPTAIDVIGWSALGASAFALGTAAAFTVQAMIKNADSKDGCVVNRCTPTGARDRRDARSAGVAATVSGLVATVLAAGGVTLLLLNDSDEQASSGHAFISPWIDGNGAGAVATGSF